MTDKSPKKARKRGRPRLKHGGYSLLSRGELPENRKHVRQYLTEIREHLIADLAAREEDLTAAQRLLVDRIICKLGVSRCIEEHIRESSVMVEGDLAPSLKAHYLAYQNSIRLDLQALFPRGLGKVARGKDFDLETYVSKRYGKK